MATSTIPGSLEPSRDMGLADRLTAVELRIQHAESLLRLALPAAIQLVEMPVDRGDDDDVYEMTPAFCLLTAIEQALPKLRDVRELIDFADRYRSEAAVEQPAANVTPIKRTGAATADDFNSPPVKDSYEQFIKLLTLAGLHDRMTAAQIRNEDGVEAAVEFLEGCTLSAEHVQQPAEPEPSLADELEHAVAHTVDRVTGLITAAPGLADAKPETLAKLAGLARQLEACARIAAFESAEQAEPK